MGAKKKDFQKEIYTDTLVNFLIVLAVVFLLAKVVTPWFNNTFDVQILSTDYQALLSFFVLIISFAVLFSFLIKKTAIKTPAVNAINKLTGKATGIRQRIRYLTIIQITVTIVFIASSIVFIRQINYLKYSDKGCDIENTFYVHSSFDKEQRDLFREQLKKYPVIQSITNSETLPLESTRFTHCKVNQNEFPVKFIFGDEKFLETYDLKLISGHNMDHSWIPRRRGTYVIPEKPYEVIVNETFVRQSGLDNPVGKVIQYFKDTKGKIVGVVEDFHYTSLRSKIQPVIISVRSGLSYSLLTIKYLPGHRKEALQIAKKEYSEFYPGKVFTPESYNFYEQYNREMLLMKAITLFTAIAVLLSVFGLFGISSLTIEDRTKEIGIRKVNGAKSKTVMAMLNTHFVRWVAIAFVVACPVAWYAMHRWLQNFAYKTNLSWWIFALAGVIALGIALLTVSWQSWRAARRNPVESLRYE